VHHERRSCEGRPLRWQAVVGNAVPSYVAADQGSTAGADHDLQHAREATVTVFRDGGIYDAHVYIHHEYDGTSDWIAAIILGADISVTMAQQDED
jgi:hypothetical protein